MMTNNEFDGIRRNGNELKIAVSVNRVSADGLYLISGQVMFPDSQSPVDSPSPSLSTARNSLTMYSLQVIGRIVWKSRILPPPHTHLPKVYGHGICVDAKDSGQNKNVHPFLLAACVLDAEDNGKFAFSLKKPPKSINFPHFFAIEYELMVHSRRIGVEHGRDNADTTLLARKCISIDGDGRDRTLFLKKASFDLYTLPTATSLWKNGKMSAIKQAIYKNNFASSKHQKIFKNPATNSTFQVYQIQSQGMILANIQCPGEIGILQPCSLKIQFPPNKLLTLYQCTVAISSTLSVGAAEAENNHTIMQRKWSDSIWMQRQFCVDLSVCSTGGSSTFISDLFSVNWELEISLLGRASGTTDEQKIQSVSYKIPLVVV